MSSELLSALIDYVAENRLSIYSVTVIGNGFIVINAFAGREACTTENVTRRL